MGASPPSSVARGQRRLEFRSLLRLETTDGFAVSYVEYGLWETPMALCRYREQGNEKKKKKDA